MAGVLSDLAQHWKILPLIIVLGIGSGLPLGYQISVTSSSSVFVKEFINQTWIRRYGTFVTEETVTLLWSTAVSIYSIGGLLGSLLSGYLLGRYGKKRCQILSNLVGITAAMFLGLCKVAGSHEMILIGRFLYGFTIGLSMNIYVQYLGEIAPRNLRGFINTTAPVFMTSGKLWGQIVGLRETLGTEALWPLMLSLSGFTKVLQLAIMPFYPETPPYLLLVKKDKERCVKAMKKYWGNHNYQAEIDNMLSEKEICRTTKTMNVLELVRDRSMRWQLYVVICISLALQLSGINAIYYYANSVFVTAGLPVEQIPYMSLGMGSCEVLSSMLCTILIERCGRKTLLLGSYGLMGVMLALLTVTLSLQGWYSWIPYCSAVLIFLYTLFFGVGPGAVTLSVVIEMCSHSSRPAVFVIISSLNWIGMYVIGVAFPYVVASLNQFCFLIFLTCILVSGIFLFVFLPETKGKSLQQITEEFNRFNFREKNSKDTAEISEKIETSV
ncbi:solute carrier family 2, facilitated glucose transporter member 11-like [Spea bombifrons]|uniref:solute carrier family 2, facilitated glucose transporter member 11-like n=1 Tax=Spea bombifrons TaxID=233779 RepID=UPI002349974C|nr:solute carrier family 2, facilitated glucose transporter member 11-like [Spea bombifrons]